jgi:PAS domain S-box-containing protein
MAARISLFGLLLLVVPVVHLFRHQGSPLAMAVGIALPALGASVLVFAGAWLNKNAFEAGHIARISRWVLLGAALGAVVGLGITAHISLMGYVIAETPFIVANIGVTGGVGGLVVGYFEAKGLRKAAAVEESSAKFQAVFEGTHDALVLADDDGTYVDANPAAADLFGVDRSELVGMSIQDFAASDFDFEREWSSFRQEKAGRGQFPLVRADGTKRIVEFAATSEVYPGHHLSALRDVTDRVTYEKQLERQHETLSFLNQILRHNVLNGVHVILARADLLAEELDDGHRDHLDAIQTRTEGIADLVGRVNRLNDTMWNGEDLEATHVCAMLRDVTVTVQESFPEAAIEIEDLPEDVVVDADPMLEEVFENLVVNAVVHNDAETPEVTVDVGADDDSVSVSVRDNGPGIPDSKKDIVFGRGEKGPASDGTGFGLYIVRALVDRYDGTVDVSDNTPRGSVLKVVLPRADRVPATA